MLYMMQSMFFYKKERRVCIYSGTCVKYLCVCIKYLAIILKCFNCIWHVCTHYTKNMKNSTHCCKMNISTLTHITKQVLSKPSNPPMPIFITYLTFLPKDKHNVNLKKKTVEN